MNTQDRRIIAALSVMTIIVVGFFSFRMYQFVQYLRTEAAVKPPGMAEFEDANRLLHARMGDSGPVAFGNSAEAIALATTYSRVHRALRQNEFKGGKPGTVLYDVILIGPPDEPPVVHDAAMREIGLLFPYFAGRRAQR
jgi:hypothetical protein